MELKKEVLLNSTYDNLINVALKKHPIKEIAGHIDDRFMGYGTANDEKLFGLDGFTWMVERQWEEMNVSRTEIKQHPVYKQLFNGDNSALIVEEIEILVHEDEETVPMFFRLSTLLEYNGKKWMLLHFHGSIGDANTLEGSAWPMEELKRRNIELEQQVAEKTADLQGKNRELEIEASIERVRAVAMGMTKPEEMLKVCRVISDQLQQFGVEHIRNVQTVIINEEKGTYHNYQYFTPYDKESFEITECDKNPTVQAMINRMLESPDAFFTTQLTGKELATFRAYRKEQGQFPDPLLDDTESVDGNFFSIGPGGLGITLYRPLNEEGLEIFKRFHNVFSLAYRRFRDIEQAEAQAREAQIELSLERIRAQATAMKESSDLLDIVVTMRIEFVNLGHEAHYFWHMRWLPDRYHKAMTSGDGSRIGMVMTLPRHIHGDIEPVAEWEKGDDPTYVLAMDVETAVEYVDKMISLGNFEQLDPQAPTLDDIRHIGGLTFIMARTTHGEIGYSLPGVVSEPPKDAVDTLVRFSAVFDLAYKRFEDLKAAERQHREAQIELALERVRARTMAMQSSDEFPDVAAVLFDQVRTLGGDLWGTGFGLCEEDEDNDEFWFANENGVFPAVSIPNTEDPAHKKMYQGWKNKMEFLALEASGEDLKSHYEYMMTLPEVRPFFQKILDEGLTFPEWQQWNAAYFSHGYLLIITLEPYSNKEILKRFARVFDQTYTRFLDLKKAEAQARESEIQLALERVRARSMAMHQSDELADLSLELVKQVQALGIDTWFCAFNIYDDHPEGSIEWGSNGQGTFPQYRTPREGVFLDYYEAGQRGEILLINEIGEDECPAHYDYLCSLPGVGEQLLKMKDAGIPFPTSQIDHVAFFKYGYIIFITFKPAPEAHDIFQRFSKVFQQTYTRFLDLQKAEAQAREAQTEAALERIRSRTMAMHQSEELQEVVAMLYQEFKHLVIDEDNIDIEVCIINEATGAAEVWQTDFSFTGKQVMLRLPFTEIYPLNEEYIRWRETKPEKRDELLIVNEYSGSIFEEFLQKLASLHGWEHVIRQFRDNQIKRWFTHNAYFSHGMLTYQGVEQTGEENLKLLQRFAKVFEQTYARFLDLQKAEAQAREAQVEAALERVRAQTMAMHNSEDVGKCVVRMFSELTALGVDEGTRFGIGILNHDNENNQLWTARKNGDEVNLHIGNIDMASHPLLKSARKAWKAQVPFHKYVLEGEDLLNYYQMLNNAPDYKIQIPIEKLPKKEIQHCFIFEHGFFYAFSPREFQPDLIHITQRFSSLYEQTYRRYLDLVKAEAQAREARIQLSLERIRAKAMAMQHSDELSDFLTVVFEQFHVLNLRPVNSQLSLLDFENNRSIFRLTGKNGATLIASQEVDLDASPVWKQKIEDFKSGHPNDVDVLFIPYDELPEIGEIFKEIVSKLPEDARPLPEDYPNGQYIVEGTFKYGYLGYSARRPPTEEEKEITRRIANEFGNVYQRFLDLQKAEAQAREAQIENALEKVRSRTMAMQHSDELTDVAGLLFNQVSALGIKTWTAGFNVWSEDNNSYVDYLSLNGEIYGPNTVHTEKAEALKDLSNARKSGVEFDVLYVEGEKIKQLYLAISGIDEKEYDLMVKDGLLPSQQYEHFVFGSKVSLMFITYEPVPEAHDIFKRLGKVFEQTYTRFLDLQKAEAQAREARIEAALERVRSQTMAMHSPRELEEVVAVIAEKLQDLGIILDANGVILCTYFKDSRDVMHWISAPDFSGSGRYLLPYFEHPIFSAAWESKMNGDDYFSRSFSIEEKNSFFEYAFEHSDYKHFPETFKQWVFQNDKHSLSFAWAENSAILIPSHTGILPTEADIEILKRFAKVFEQAYVRFMDLQTKEEQAAKIAHEKQRLEKTLYDLQLTQKQLIHSEKMASLGELTAGIAHEIQNPLNFVNNFSEVNMELMEELKAQSLKLKAQRDEALEEELWRDLQENEKKINHHGKRADAIVKGMLQHSRTSSGIKEPTDINALADEYLRLAYHGLRAKDKAFNADFMTELEPSMPRINVIPQDIGRVLLNLINNAFHAVSEKTKKGIPEYKPLVTVKTRKHDHLVEIRVKDNGDGIPDDIVNKIFQPFFTTKPTGEGTGLGLSLSYDIVTKGHNGTLEVDTAVGLGSEFVISLPVG